MRLFKNNQWIYLKNSQDYILWHTDSSTLPWEEVISCYADDIDTDINTILSQSSIYIDNFIKTSSKILCNEFNNKIISNDNNYDIYTINNNWLKGIVNKRTIFYLDWNGLIVITWGKRKIIRRLISKLSLGENLHNFIKSKLKIGPYFDNLCQRMLIEENDEIADAIGRNDHINRITIDMLKEALHNYIKILLPIIPEYEFVKLEGWFNSRLFNDLLKEYKFIDSLNLGEKNILDPWNKIISSD